MPGSLLLLNTGPANGTVESCRRLFLLATIDGPHLPSKADADGVVTVPYCSANLCDAGAVLYIPRRACRPPGSLDHKRTARRIRFVNNTFHPL